MQVYLFKLHTGFFWLFREIFIVEETLSCALSGWVLNFVQLTSFSDVEKSIKLVLKTRTDLNHALKLPFNFWRLGRIWQSVVCQHSGNFLEGCIYTDWLRVKKMNCPHYLIILISVIIIKD